VNPAAYAVGLARHAADGRLLDAWFPRVNVDEHPESGAKIRAAARIENGTVALRVADAERLLETIHGINADTIRSLLPAAAASAIVPRTLIVTVIGSLNDAPVDAGDVYLRLHLLSMRRIRPHGANLAGIFALLENVAWTNLGPLAPDEIDAARLAAYGRGEQFTVHGVDKFPRMVDYVVPSGVRIADADRVRLGAHLAEGTTVMHEGFVNFNAGTLGASMIEGRISAGVVIGDGSDVGGGASIMGTLSGGNDMLITVGERCLLGANSGLGIPLGDDCTLESGLYLTAGTKVRLPDGTVASARQLSGINGMLFRRDSQTGAVHALSRAGAGWHGLNAALHAN
jgi:2,3,4,5-tetrahydropyridine-2,6-dicarboxylate N-succinyltransferase